MLYIETGRNNAAFNFAFEEYCIDRILKENQKIVSIWQADNCVMLGNYQIAHKEINERFCKKLQPAIVRRATGGGAIYTDMGTLLFTVIMKIKDYSEIDFADVCAPFVNALNEIGVKAELCGRNDILIGNKKISGNAQTVKNGCLCSHGSLLYNTDLDILSDILQPDEAKIKSKAINSIRSRVTNISEHISSPPPIDIFWKQLKNTLRRQDGKQWEEYALTKDDIREIEKIKAEKYDTWEWNYGKTPSFSYQNERRYPMGKLTIGAIIDKGLIKEFKLYGDFLGVTDIAPLENMLINCRYDFSSVSEKIGDTDLYPYLRGITKEQLLDCVFDL